MRDIKLISWTLAGPGTGPIVGDALRSVAPLTERCVVVLTDPDGEAIDDLAELIQCEGAARWIVLERWRWQNDYGAARNAGLAFAVTAGADWSCMIDTDERAICPDPEAFRSWLAAIPVHIQVVLAHHEDGSHTRERFFRMPPRHKFGGKTHEMYGCPANEQAIAPRELIQWSELPKTPEQLRAKFARDVTMLREDIAERPENGAALYYLGMSLQSLALYDREDGNEEAARVKFGQAIEAYREHRRLDVSGSPAWHEGTAFSCYRAAECYLAMGEPDRAIDCALAGMALDAGIAELPWIAAVASLHVGRLEQARCWAELSKTHALGSEAERRRVGFRLPRGLTTGPDEILNSIGTQVVIVCGADPPFGQYSPTHGQECELPRGHLGAHQILGERFDGHGTGRIGAHWGGPIEEPPREPTMGSDEVLAAARGEIS